VCVSGVVQTDDAFDNETLTLRVGSGENDLRCVRPGWQSSAVPTAAAGGKAAAGGAAPTDVVAVVSARYGSGTSFVDVREKLGVVHSYGKALRITPSVMGVPAAGGSTRGALKLYAVIGPRLTHTVVSGATSKVLPGARELAGSTVPAGTDDSLLATVILSAVVTPPSTGASGDSPSPSSKKGVDVTAALPGVVLGGAALDVSAAIASAEGRGGGTLTVVCVSGVVQTDDAFDNETLTLRVGSGKNDLRCVRPGWNSVKPSALH
jgi:hypothetical protein